MTTLAFVDTETTGLDPMHHEIWEVALILRHDNGTETEHAWQLPVDLGKADPIALNIGQFHQRRHDPSRFTALDVFAREFTGLTHSAHLVGAVVSFDEERLRRLLRRNHECPMWHYHVVDVEALAAGWLSTEEANLELARPPWRSEDLSRGVGVEPTDFERHTALGDARWAKAIYDAVLGPRDSTNEDDDGPGF